MTPTPAPAVLPADMDRAFDITSAWLRHSKTCANGNQLAAMCAFADFVLKSAQQEGQKHLAACDRGGVTQPLTDEQAWAIEGFASDMAANMAACAITALKEGVKTRLWKNYDKAHNQARNSLLSMLSELSGRAPAPLPPAPTSQIKGSPDA